MNICRSSYIDYWCENGQRRYASGKTKPAAIAAGLLFVVTTERTVEKITWPIGVILLGHLGSIPGFTNKDVVDDNHRLAFLVTDRFCLFNDRLDHFAVNRQIVG